jgi:hypothetical protein
LTDVFWTTIPGSVAGTGNTISMTDTNFGADATRFYRVTTFQ